ncbi:MAG: hypothetical protein ACI93L_001855, partial [Cyclobacteriaceae bacterium]
HAIFLKGFTEIDWSTNFDVFSFSIKIIRSRRLTDKERDLRIVYYDWYGIRQGGVY